jgi:hypothetical protein
MALKSSHTDISVEAQLAKDVLQLLETHCESSGSSDYFLKAYIQVQQNARAKREERKSKIQLQVITNPVVAAQRRIQKQTTEKRRRQRRIQERRSERGGTKKRQYL